MSEELRQGYAEFLGISEEQLMEDGAYAAMIIHRRATISHNQIWAELVRRYGKDAPISIRLDEQEAHVLIDGEKRRDVLGAVVTEKGGRAHVFLDVVGFHPEDMATVKIGDTIVLTRPAVPAAHLPWPPDPAKRLVARLGELLEQESAGFVVENE
jgi:hypothetical protein